MPVSMFLLLRPDDLVEISNLGKLALAFMPQDLGQIYAYPIMCLVSDDP